MTKHVDSETEQSDLIQRTVAALLTEARKTRPEKPAQEKAAPTRARRTGRRYSPSEQRAILAAVEQGQSSAELRDEYGVARETVSRWRRRDKQAKNLKAPAEKFTEPGEAPEPPTAIHKGYHPHWREVLKTWRTRPGMGPAQVRNQLHRARIKITVATVRKIMEENGYTPPKPTVKEVQINNYEAVRPLELVHMDFKHFYINRQKVFLLLIQDDFSRFLCGHRMTDSENIKTVIEAFEECVNRYGKMQSLITDAGSAFYSWNGINRFQRLLSEEYGVDQIKARSPRSNGKLENVNKQIEKEVLNVEKYASLEEADNAIREWLRFYNFERTHLGLPAGMVPADRFLPGWNTALPAAIRSDSKEKLVQGAWEEVLKLALSQIKRAA